MNAENTPSRGPASVVSALRLSEERACEGYLAARKAMVVTGTRALSLGRLVAEQPERADYREAWFAARATHTDALIRTEVAHERWLRAQLRTDAAWTAGAEFKDAAWLNRIIATCSDLKADLTIAWVFCDAETMHTYVRHRGAARDSTKLADWDTYIASIDLDFRPLIEHHVIDNSASGLPLQSQARSFLATLDLGRSDSEGRDLAASQGSDQ
ncbi:hypothetical protein [Actinokineospora xionganensis]|uniref:AAA domain-containing protein n=1 Tax=Actinokineospora xionganensis TaxID=2684470 RepID=A0ABR7L2Q0_9PSEU|nr:hypothetical protein [Actinokineospora xionganensis]MBC6446966.1 hypothetical protein [Actinokineospora xionganensis]